MGRKWVGEGEAKGRQDMRWWKGKEKNKVKVK